MYCYRQALFAAEQTCRRQLFSLSNDLPFFKSECFDKTNGRYLSVFSIKLVYLILHTHILYILYILYRMYILHSTVHTVHTVYTLRTVHTTLSVHAVHAVHTVHYILYKPYRTLMCKSKLTLR